MTRLALAALLCTSCVGVHVRHADAGPDAENPPDGGAPDDTAQVPDGSDEVAVDAPDVDAVESGQGGAPGVGGSGSGGTGAGGGGLGGAGMGGSSGTAPTPSAVGQVLIVEIMFDSAAAPPPVGGTSDDVGEWVELQNQTDTAFDLYGCSLLDTSHADTIANHVPLPPRGLVTLARSVSAGFPPDYVYPTVKFSDSGDIARFTCGALVVDVVDFRMGFTLMQSYSLSRDSSGAWCAPTRIYNATTKGIDHGTPGTLNDPCGGDR